ncbi:MAG TPA: DUF433 domain-containing protein [Gemmataceae bacterium]|nr:DUF433 domain-containing protein [Gemmataceae bacterium]
MKLPDFLTEWPFGEIVLTGHRISLYDILYFHKEGYSAEMLHEQFPTLSLDHIEKVLAFARENQAEVDAYVDRCQKEIDHLRATTPRLLDWDEMRRKFEAMKQAERK